MYPPLSWSASDLVRAYAAGTLSPVEVTKELFNRVVETNQLTNALYAFDQEGALSAALDSERRWRDRMPASQLDGVPVSIKDHISTKGTPITWGCRLPECPPPSTIDSAVVARLREAGAIVFGKTTMCELGFYPGSVSPGYGPSRNPWNIAKTAGGSSGGAAAAVSSCLGPIAIASDGGGSIRIPASFTAAFGFKPGGGRVPVTSPPLGANPTVGPMTRTVRDAAVTLSILTRPDPGDYFALPADGKDYACGLVTRIDGVRIGALTSMGYGTALAPTVARCFRSACEVLQRAGAIVELVDAPFDFNAFNALSPALLPSYAQRFIDISGGRIDCLLESTQAVLKYTLGLSARQIMAANKILNWSNAKFMSLFADYDYLISPSLAITAFGVEHAFPENAPLNDWGYAFDFASFVPLVNFCALPACSICCGFDGEGMPIGLQIVAKRYDDFGLIRVASAYEKSRQFDIPWPEEPRRYADAC